MLNTKRPQKKCRQIVMRQLNMRHQLTLIALAFSPALLYRQTMGTTKTYVGPLSSDWNTAGNWSPSGVPAAGANSTTAGDTVNISTFSAVLPFRNTVVTFDTNYGITNPLGPLTIDATGYATATLSMGFNTLAVYGAENVGVSGTGTFNQNGGYNLLLGSSGYLYLGQNANSNGTYNMNNANGTPNLSVYQAEFVGVAGTGTFNQNAGTQTVGTYMAIAGNAGSTGSYALTNGTLYVGATGSANTAEVVGNGGTGSFSQYNGSNNVGSASVPQNLYVGYLSTALGSYSLNGSNAVLNVYGNAYIGESAVGNFIHFIINYGGTFNHIAGTVNVSGNLILGDASGATGSYTLGNGTGSPTLNVAGSETIGNSGVALFTQNGGNNNITTTTGTFNVGQSNGSTATYVLNNGTLNTNGADNSENIGVGGNGTFTQNGGVNNVGHLGDGDLSLGGVGGSGTYRLNPVSGNAVTSLLIASSEYVGISSTGTFIQTGGTNDLSDVLQIGGFGGGSGSYTLTGGTLSVSAYEILGTGAFRGTAGGVGIFVQQGGTNTIGTAANPGIGLYIANDPQTENGNTAGATYSINSSSASLTVYGAVVLGEYDSMSQYGDIGLLNISAGTVTVSGAIAVADNSTITLSGSGVLTAGGIQATGDYVGSVNNPINWSSGTLHLTASSFVVGSTGLFGSQFAVLKGMTLITDAGLNITSSSELDLVGGAITVSSGSTATNQGIFAQGSGSLTVNGVFVNSGTASFSGTQSWGPGSVFVNQAGTATFSSTLSSTGFGPVVVVTGGTVSFPAVQHLTSLTVGTGALVQSTVPGLDQLLTTQGLTFAGTTNNWTGQLDLGHNDLDVVGGLLGQITNQVKQGYSNGTWTGTGLTSGAAAADTTHLTALGVIQNNQGGTPLYGPGAVHPLFDGTSPGASDVLVKYTYYGDTNLDGKVDGSDYSRIDFAIVADKTNPTAYTGWFNGDFNYDGVINGSDYTLIDNAFNRQGAALTSEIADPAAAVTTEIASPSAVPEPATLGLLNIAAVACLSRRRRISTLEKGI